MRDAPEKQSLAEAAAAKTILEALVSLRAEQVFSSPALVGRKVAHA